MFYINLFMMTKIIALSEDYEKASIDFYRNHSKTRPINIQLLDYISEEIKYPPNVNFSIEFNFKKKYEANLNTMKTLLSYVDSENDILKKVKSFNFYTIVLSNNDVKLLAKALSEQIDSVKKNIWDDVFHGRLYPNGSQSVTDAAHETLLIYASFVRFLQETENDGNVLEIYYD